MIKRTILGFLTILLLILVFLFVTIPSVLYGISCYLLLPIGFLFRLFIGKPTAISVALISFKLSTVFLLLVVPFIFYLNAGQRLGWILFSWIAIYLLIRVYSGVHGKEIVVIKAWKDLAVLEKQMQPYKKHNLLITVILLSLNITAIVLGNRLGGEKGLYISIVISIIMWWLAPFEGRE